MQNLHGHAHWSESKLYVMIYFHFIFIFCESRFTLFVPQTRWGLLVLSKKSEGRGESPNLYWVFLRNPHYPKVINYEHPFNSQNKPLFQNNMNTVFRSFPHINFPTMLSACCLSFCSCLISLHREDTITMSYSRKNG